MKTEEERNKQKCEPKKETAGEADLVKTFDGTSLKKISAAESNLRCKNKESNWRV